MRIGGFCLGAIGFYFRNLFPKTFAATPPFEEFIRRICQRKSIGDLFALFRDWSPARAADFSDDFASSSTKIWSETNKYSPNAP